MEIRRYDMANDEEFLRQVSQDVDFQKDDIISYIKILKEYSLNNAVFAIAAVQLGIPKRIIYFRNTTSDMTKNETHDYNEDLVMINPKILNEKGKTLFLEACDSCSYFNKDQRIYYASLVERPYAVEIEYYNLEGKKITEKIEEFKSTVFYHEYDHLNGILHIDKGTDVKEMSIEEIHNYRNENPYKIVRKK